MTDGTVLETPSQVAIRDELQRLVLDDLLGPGGGETEELPDSERPTDRYILGRLAPTEAVIEPSEQDRLADDEPADPHEGDAEPEAPNTASLFPATIGLSCCVRASTRALRVRARWGRYERARVTVDEQPRRVWRRVPEGGTVTVELSEGDIVSKPPDPEQPGVTLRGRARRIDGEWHVSLFLVNGQGGDTNKQEAWVFQAELTVTPAAETPESEAAFCPRHPATAGGDATDKAEQRALAMSYRFHPEFAVGHGVGVRATATPGDPTHATEIRTAAAPSYEVPQTAAPGAGADPDLAGLGRLVTDMAELGTLRPDQLGPALTPLVETYRTWIDAREETLGDPGSHLGGYEKEAREHLAAARQAAGRIEAGITLVATDPTARAAFQFANQAMHLQRIHTIAADRRRRDPDITLARALADADQPASRSWRPFQLAFVLLNLPALADPQHPERAGNGALADLLWFPTGGGKTEAYLGLTAFTLALRRLQPQLGGHDPSAGVAVLMRYTLRLLTIQQFQRATALICACETLRRGDPDTWGETPFRVGLWVGLRVTPNSTDDAEEWCKQQRRQTGALRARGSPHQLTNCPWCGEHIEPGRDIRVDPVHRRTLVTCPNIMDGCPFGGLEPGGPGVAGEGLPVLLVDEEIYRLLPSLLIATVDKFAQLPWQGATQALFGLVTQRCQRHGYLTADIAASEWENRTHPAKGDAPAARTAPVTRLRPPDLIIQDELHLIAGPLGSLTGLYESAIDRLSTWKHDGSTVRPKVVASTATVRRAPRQIGALFYRRTQVFPPPGLDAADSFFARQRPTGPTGDSTAGSPGEALPGRRYVGICAHGTRMKSTLIRVYVATLGAAQRLHEKYGRNDVTDPYMTLVGYFNSLRDLGGMRRLVDDDVSTRLTRADQRGLARRYDVRTKELTSRLGSDQIPDVLDQLGVPFTRATRDTRARDKGSPRPIDVLLATSMIAVGVDVPRLGLMVVANQPKSAAEYIQATSRVGRAAPGLIFSVLNWARPRDLSHFEHFEHFHATFYRHVEALSVTPYADRALHRGLTGVLVALARHSEREWNANLGAGSFDRHGQLADHIVRDLQRRSADVTSDNQVGHDVAQALDARLDHWAREQQQPGRRLAYSRPKRADDVAGLLAKPEEGRWRWNTCPTSLREVEPGIRLLLMPDYDLGDDGAPAFRYDDGEEAT